MQKNILKWSPTLLFHPEKIDIISWKASNKPCGKACQVEKVIATCEVLSVTCELARKAAHYFYFYAERMRYDPLPDSRIYDW
jgi:hypothetical protein